ncbi:MAG: YceI family protein [Flavobacteriaceae bacterium]
MFRSFYYTVFLMGVMLVHAQDKKWQLNTETSKISYSANHILHPWKGINTNVKGVVVVAPETKDLKEMAVLARVQDFDSKNEGRDAHALEVLESLSFPEVRFYSNLIEQKKDSLFIHGQLDFHGVLKNTTIVGIKKTVEDQLVLSGNFEIKPTDFQIELPSFMMVKMDDLLKFEFELRFTE